MEASNSGMILKIGAVCGMKTLLKNKVRIQFKKLLNKKEIQFKKEFLHTKIQFTVVHDSI